MQGHTVPARAVFKQGSKSLFPKDLYQVTLPTPLLELKKKKMMFRTSPAVQWLRTHVGMIITGIISGQQEKLRSHMPRGTAKNK